MKGILTIILTLWGCLCFAQMQNKTSFSLGTNGAGITYEKEIHPQLSVGSSANYLYISGSTVNYLLENFIKTNFKTNSLQLEGFVKWFPLANNDRLYAKGGLSFRFNPSYAAHSRFLDKTMIGSFELSRDQSGYVNIDIRTNRLQPMLGAGYSIINKDKFFLNLEAGTYFHGKPQVIMEATGTLHLNTVNQQAIQDKIYKYKYFPVLKIETGIKF